MYLCLHQQLRMYALFIICHVLSFLSHLWFICLGNETDGGSLKRRQLYFQKLLQALFYTADTAAHLSQTSCALTSVRAFLIDFFSSLFHLVAKAKHAMVYFSGAERPEANGKKKTGTK